MNDPVITTGILSQLAGLVVILAVVRRLLRARSARPARRPPRSSIVPAARPAAAQVVPAAAPRRRLSEPRPVPAAPPLEAAGAFAGVDLSLGDGALPDAASPRRRRLRAVAGAAPIGSRGWGTSAIVAAEVLGPPVALRSGATVGVPHAF